jgi:two-component system response regulator AlgR
LLIVDRDPAARRRLRTQLRALHRRFPVQIVAEADDGRSARDVLDTMAAQAAPHIVLLDVVLPDGSGLAFAEEFRKRPAAPQIILIGPSDDALNDAGMLDVAATLRRPVRADQLEEALRTAAARHVAMIQAAAPPEMHDGVARAVANGVAGIGPGVGHNAGRNIGPNVGPDAGPAVSPSDFLPIVPQSGRDAVAVDDILFLRAELKYVLIRTRDAEYLTEQPLTRLLGDHPDRFVQAHRAALVARHAIAGARRVAAGERDPAADVYWELLLHGTAERIPVSRRRWREIRPLVAGLALDLQ